MWNKKNCNKVTKQLNISKCNLHEPPLQVHEGLRQLVTHVHLSAQWSLLCRDYRSKRSPRVAVVIERLDQREPGAITLILATISAVGARRRARIGGRNQPGKGPQGWALGMISWFSQLLPKKPREKVMYGVLPKHTPIMQGFYSYVDITPTGLCC